jgi:hypothetical protein
VGLWLNLPRLRLARATEYALGLWARETAEDLPRAWADAAAPTEEEVEALYHRMRAQRVLARGRARAGG